MDRCHFRRWAAGVLGAIVLGATVLTGAGPSAAAPASTATPHSVVFSTAGCTLWPVPAGVPAISIAATGAAGASGSASGGRGDGVSVTLSGLSGGSLDVCVDVGGGAGGGVGQPATLPGAAGGGASGVGLGSDFSRPVVIAGGGGGGGVGSGGSAGSPVAAGGLPAPEGGGGGDNLTRTGGAGGGVGVGGPGSGFSAAGPGSGGAGAEGGANFTIGFGGGGGGAGYYGGGGGGVLDTFIPHQPVNGAGGGGGTDFCGDSYPGGTSAQSCVISAGAGTATAPGVAAGDPQVVLTYTSGSTHLAASPLWVPLYVGRVPVGTAIAQLTDAGGAPLAGRTLVFSAGTTKVCEVTTGSNGVASCRFSLTAVIAAYLAGDRYTVTFAGDERDLPATATGPVEIGLGR